MQPQVRGLRPFLVTGPGFEQWVIPGSLQKRGHHVLRPQVKRMLGELFPAGGIHRRHYQHMATAETLLREGVLLALWSVDSPECLAGPDRWDEAVQQLCRELPFRHPMSFATGDGFWEIDEAVSEYLSGMPSPAMAREYVSEDRLTLEAMPVPGP
jgi:hypothetical protein